MKSLFLPFRLSVFIIFLGLSPNALAQTNASINKFYKKEILQKTNSYPFGGLVVQELSHSGHARGASRKNRVLVKIKSYRIDGKQQKEQTTVLNLPELRKSKANAIAKGVGLMRVGDQFRFFLQAKLDYDKSRYLYIEEPLVHVYEVELLSILDANGQVKFTNTKTEQKAIISKASFDTKSIYDIAKQKAWVQSERRRYDREALDRLILLEDYEGSW